MTRIAVGLMLLAAVVAVGWKWSQTPSFPTYDDATFRPALAASSGDVLVMYSAPWCGICTRLMPGLKDLHTADPSLAVWLIDYDNSPQLAAEHGLRGVPALFLYRDGKMIGAFRDLPQKPVLEGWLREVRQVANAA